MPVAAREASIYTGIAIAEYYRDMGYHVALMADSTSRWAEAMREISSRLEEMPGEEGYPAYLSTRLAEFYERAGENRNTEQRNRFYLGYWSSISSRRRLLRASNTRHFACSKSILGIRSSSFTTTTLSFYQLDRILFVIQKKQLVNGFEDNVKKDWNDKVGQIARLLQEEEKLSEVVRLVGSDALAEREQLTLYISRMIRESILQQNAFHDIDTYCAPEKTYLLMSIILEYYERGLQALDAGKHLEEITSIKAKDKISLLKFEKAHDKLIATIQKEMKTEFDAL